MIGARGTTAQVAMASANTEYSYTFPVGTCRFTMKLEVVGSEFNVAFKENESGADEFITIPIGSSYEEIDIKMSAATIYFQSPGTSQVMHIKSWIR